MCGLVMPVTGAGGLDAVLKLQFPDRESTYEAEALRAWDGRGAVHLLDHDPEHHALLLERLLPGTPLSLIDSDDALTVMVELLQKLPVPGGTTPFTSITEEAAVWRRALPETWQRAGRPFESDLVTLALDLLDDLLSSQQNGYLVHQDLHGDNVLASQRGWLAIDPKPLLAEVAFAAAPIIRSAELGHSRSAAVQRLDRLSAAVGIDRHRAAAWTIVQTMAWSFDELTPIEGHLDVVRWMREEL